MLTEEKKKGLTRAPVSTTFTQIFTRCVQVWVVNHGYPELYTTGTGPGLEQVYVYRAMLLAWSVADIVRYAYFVVLLGGKMAGFAVPGGLVWLRWVTPAGNCWRKVLNANGQVLAVLRALSGGYWG